VVVERIRLLLAVVGSVPVNSLSSIPGLVRRAREMQPAKFSRDENGGKGIDKKARLIMSRNC
jgi:hypothetical protein